VGRSKRRAWVYLLIPGEHIITRDAKRRIEALRELVEAESGTGFKLAIRDLEHRGAGNLLGREQSGTIAAVGFELYTEMMEQAIRELRGEPQRPDFEPELRLGIPAYIPDSFVPDENERLVLYRRMARAAAARDLDEVRDEMRDRFGPVPTLVENLIAAMNVRRQMRELMIVSALLKKDQLEIKFHPEAPLESEKLVALANANRRTLRLTPSFQVMVTLNPGEYEQTYAQIDGILQALAACEKLENWHGGSAGPLIN
jgi:transcription-repair coupling factor (superfamily II helicase)